jgi:hypothetical protein
MSRAIVAITKVRPNDERPAALAPRSLRPRRCLPRVRLHGRPLTLQQVAKMREEEASDASWFVLPEEGDDVNWMSFSVEVEGPVRGQAPGAA